VEEEGESGHSRLSYCQLLYCSTSTFSRYHHLRKKKKGERKDIHRKGEGRGEASPKKRTPFAVVNASRTKPKEGDLQRKKKEKEEKERIISCTGRNKNHLPAGDRQAKRINPTTHKKAI